MLAVIASLALGSVWAAGSPTKLVYFDPEDFSLSQAQKTELETLLPILETATAVEVRGYVQRSREADKNKGPANLSYKRAEAVANYLQSLLKEKSKNKRTIDWVVIGAGQPALDMGLPDARRVEIDVR